MSEQRDMRAVCLRALETFDRFDQIAKAVEELNELGAAIMRTVSNGFSDGNDAARAIVDEIADVRIMIEQLTILFGESHVQERIAFKLDRLDRTIERRRVEAGMRAGKS